MKKLISISAGILLAVSCSAKSAFDGIWYLVEKEGCMPAPGARWIKVDTVATPPKVDVLWEIGGVEPAKNVELRPDGGRLTFDVPWDYWYMTTSRIRRENLGCFQLNLTPEKDQGGISLMGMAYHADGKPAEIDGTREFVVLDCKRAAPMPPAPDVAALKFGDPITLFDGETLNGWRIADMDGVSKIWARDWKGLNIPKDISGWGAKDGILFNQPKLEDMKMVDGKPDFSAIPPQFGNLRTEREFEDFRLTLEVRLPKGGNSGIYLRGRYEVQVADTFGRPPSPGMIGAIYSRVTPTVNAAKPAGEWQTFDITFADRHATVILNGQKVIDNQPVEGCTGGALDSDDSKPGPIYFQGDHTAVEYRNMIIYPRVK